MMDKAAIEWCKVFGADDQDTHWKRVFEERDQTRVREEFLAAAGMPDGD